MLPDDSIRAVHLTCHSHSKLWRHAGACAVGFSRQHASRAGAGELRAAGAIVVGNGAVGVRSRSGLGRSGQGLPLVSGRRLRLGGLLASQSAAERRTMRDRHALAGVRLPLRCCVDEMECNDEALRVTHHLSAPEHFVARASMSFTFVVASGTFVPMV